MESVERTKNETRRDLDATRGGDVNAGVGASGVGSLGGGVRSGTRSIHGIGGAVGGAVGVDVGGDRVGGGDAGAGVGVDFVGGGHVVGDTYDSIVICRDLEKRFPGAEGEHGLRRSFFDDWDDERGQALADFMGLEPTKKVGTMSGDPGRFRHERHRNVRRRGTPAEHPHDRWNGEAVVRPTTG